jgi:arylamine N-acetyltransferase
MWVYSYRENDEAEWVNAYAFTEMEFFAEDFEVMNLSTMTLRQSFFVQSLFCVKMVLDNEGEGNKPVGWLVLHGDKVTKKVGGKTKVLEELKTEEERVAALKKWFGIELSGVERMGIRELPTELRGWKMG